jgi:DNA ligase-1
LDTFAAVCEDIARHASKTKKVTLLARYLQTLEDEQFALAIQFLSQGPVAEGPRHNSLFGSQEEAKLSIGHSALRQAISSACEWDGETLRVCFGEVGDAGETAALLMRRNSLQKPLDLGEANQIYQRLFRATSSDEKKEILTGTIRAYKPLAVKYWIKVITRSFRIGLMSRLVEDAVAQACGVPQDEVRDANNRLGNLAHVGLAARRRELEKIGARLFHPMQFMLAKPLDRVEDIANPDAWFVEDKYDGIRTQVHFDSGHVRIYSRGMDEITNAFPEIESRFKYLPGDGIVDGELLAWSEGRALNFNVLQQRIARKRVSTTLMQQIPAAFIGYDLLLRNGKLLFDVPIEVRRGELATLLASAGEGLFLSPQREVATREEIDVAFAEARKRGNEGLLLKRKGSRYEPGKRSGQWQKLKRPYATLDVVITSAEQGSGRRASVFSDYTFAVRSGPSFVNIGKAYSGLTDSEVKELTRILRAASTDRFGPVMIVRPEIVLEVAFDGVQKSSRHKSGYALRFPRIVRWRRDKKPEESDDLARVASLYEASLC